MSTEQYRIDSQELADQEAILRHAHQGEPLDPRIRRRVHERAARISEEIYRTHGLIDDETLQLP